MVHVVDFEEGNDLCHVTKPPKVPGSRPKATLPATVLHKQSIGVGGHLSTYGTWGRTGKSWSRSHGSVLTKHVAAISADQQVADWQADKCQT